VTFQQLEKTLTDFGFTYSTSAGHAIFRHPVTGSVLTVPNGEQPIRQIYVNTAARQVANSGIATVKAFESRLTKYASA